jgi:demethylmenaquinone methyltransferase/2-methoxy-6-polyprenyl-1,4-benzoquinol methylase
MARQPADDAKQFAVGLFSGLPRRYDLLAEVLSMGQNARWRLAMVDHVLPSSPSSILDVASGTAGVAIQLARRAPTARVTGVDITPGMLREGARRVASAGVGDRVGLVAGRAEQLPFPTASFDALTFTYLLRYVADPAETLRELARVVRPGGLVASLEFAVPEQPFWHAAWWAYTRLVLPAAGFVTGGKDWWRVGRFLGPNISGHYARYPVSWTVRAWEEAGFEEVRTRRMSLGGGLVMSGRRSDG